MSLGSINAVNLFTDRREFLHQHVNHDSLEKLFVISPKLQTALGVLVIDNFLRDKSSYQLDRLEFDRDGNCVDWSDNEVASGLVSLMQDTSRLYIDQHPLQQFHQSIKRMSFSPGDKTHFTLVPKHHDWKDGNTVLYNFNPIGHQVYNVGDDEIQIKHNQLTILNGDSTFLPREKAYGTAVHDVQPDHDVLEPELWTLGRDRILVFCDGDPTAVTMLPPEV